MIERVLLAVDCFEHSGNALDFMARLQGSIGGVIVLTVVDNAFTLSRSGLRFDSDEREEYPPPSAKRRWRKSRSGR